MTDIKRVNALVNINSELKKKHMSILVQEKLSNIAGLKQRLSDLQNIEANRLSLQIEVLEKEIDQLEKEINEV